MAYQNIVNAQEHARIIRGFGFGYFAYGSFGDRETYDMFNKAVVALQVDYRMAQRHSKFIKPFRGISLRRHVKLAGFLLGYI